MGHVSKGQARPKRVMQPLLMLKISCEMFVVQIPEKSAHTRITRAQKQFG